MIFSAAIKDELYLIRTQIADILKALEELPGEIVKKIKGEL